MKQITKQQALAIYYSGVWKSWSDDEIVRFQLYQKRLAVEFRRFHEAVEAVLGRPVWTHEFADWKCLQAKYEGERDAPTMDEIIDMIPVEKRILITNMN